MKKIKQIVSTALITTTLLTSIVYATPTDWAVDFVEGSIDDDLVPVALQANYQDTIKRYEYVLLALEILEKNNVDIIITETAPFNDILGHPYENEIVKAFNAGIIDGYGDGTFKPNQDIKREEITALVYNLVKGINAKVTLPTLYGNYSDTDEISPWAKPYVEFCYGNQIMSGTGTINNLDTMSPQGKATREQAIALLYKVFENKTLLNKSLPVEIVVGDEVIKGDLGSIAIQTNQMVGEFLQAESQGDASITTLTDNYLALDYDQDSIMIQISKNIVEANVVVNDLSDSEALTAYYKLLDELYDTATTALVKAEVEKLKSDATYRYTDFIKTDLYLSVFKDEDQGMYGIQLDDSTY